MYVSINVCMYLSINVCMYVKRKSVDDVIGTYVTGHMLANSLGRTHSVQSMKRKSRTLYTSADMLDQLSNPICGQNNTHSVQYSATDRN